MTGSYAPYYPGGWHDGPSTATPINAAALNGMDAGITAANCVFSAASPQYGVKGDGTTDDRAALQSVIDAAQAAASSLTVFGTANVLNLVPTVVIPPGNYLLGSPLNVAATAGLRITGNPGARLFSNSSALFDFQNHAVQALEIDHLTFDATGGHVFANANLKFSAFHHLQLLQRSPGYAVWDQEQAGNQLQNSSFTDILYYVCPDPSTGLRSAAAWKIYCDTAASFAEVQFTRLTGFNLANSGGTRDTSQYLFDLACTAQGASSYMTQVAFRDCSFHRCYGGAVKAQSAAGLLVDHLTVQDIYTSGAMHLTNPVISVGTYGTGPASRGIWVRNYHRGGTAATGAGADPSDLTVSGDTVNVRADGFIMTTTPASDLPQINLNGAAQAIITSADSGVTVLGPAGDTVVISGGAVTAGGVAVTQPNNPGPASNGALAQNFDPMCCASTGAAMVSGTVYCLRVDVSTGITVGHLWYNVTSGGSGGTAGQCLIALYNSAGTQLSAPADITGNLGGGTQKIAITANGGQSLTLVPGTYYVLILVAATGMPSLARSASGAPNIGVSGAALRAAVNGTSQTSLPSPATLTGNTGTGSLAFWVGLAS